MSGKADKAAKNAQSLQQPAAAPATAAKLPAGFKVERVITLPSMSLKTPGEGKVLRFDSLMRISDIKQKAAAGKDMEPATIANVTDMETGEQAILLVSAVVKSNLERDYPKGEYKGKCFWVCNRGKRKPGQRYVDFDIQEVSPSK